jgi:LysM repeat protein
MWYGQKNYSNTQGINGKYTIAQIGCFVTSFCNLLQKFGKEVDPPSLNRLFIQRGIYVDVDDGVRDDLGWASITAYDGAIQVTGQGSGWTMPHNNCIVKFAYKSPKTGQPMTHFCLVADGGARTIVDSWDGVIRTPGYYGDPVAWATYSDVEPEPVVVQPAPAAVPKSTATSGDIVILQKGDTIAAIAVRYGLGTKELLDHNGLTWEDARNLPVGYAVKLPIKNAPAPADVGYKVEAIDPPKIMHTNKEATKWGFGNVKDWKDFVPNGKVAANTNIEVVGVANVIVGKEVAAYYMDKLAFGDWKASGQLNNTIGFNWSDLTDGAYEEPKPEPVPEAPKPAEDAKPVEVAKAAPQPVVSVVNTSSKNSTVVSADTITAPDGKVTFKVTATGQQTASSEVSRFKTTYKAWAKPIAFLVLNDGYAYELDGRRPNKPIHKNQVISIGGSFIKDQTLYFRPAGAAQAFIWWGIPADNLISEEAVFNTQVDLPDKVAMHYVLTVGEKFQVVLARLLNSFTKIKQSTKGKK